MEYPKVLSEPWRLGCWRGAVLRLLSSKALREGFDSAHYHWPSDVQLLSHLHMAFS